VNSGIVPRGPGFASGIPPIGFGSAAVGVGAPYPGGVFPSGPGIRTSTVQVGGRAFSPIPGGIQTFGGRVGSPIIGGAFGGGPISGGPVRQSRIAVSPPIVGPTTVTAVGPVVPVGPNVHVGSGPIGYGIGNSGIIGGPVMSPPMVSNYGGGAFTSGMRGPPQIMSSVIQQPPVVTTTVTDTFTSGLRRSRAGLISTPPTMMSTPFVQPSVVTTTVTEEIVEQVNPQQGFITPMQSVGQSGVFMPTPAFVQPYGFLQRCNNCCPRICGLPWWIPLILALLALGGLLTGLGYGYKALSEGNTVEKGKDNVNATAPADS